MPKFDLSPYHGIFPAGMTFFDAEGNLDQNATLDHWQWLVDQGVHGLVVAGTSGEFISLTIEERLQLCRLAVKNFGGQLPIIAGTGHASTKLTIDISREAQDIGVDSLIVILPYYSRPPMASVIEHYRELRRRTDRPIMLYNNPANTACTALSAPQIAQLVDEDVVHMVKSTMESVVPIHDLSLLTGDSMRIFYGSFLAALEGFAGGAHGWISGVLNVAADRAIRMYRAVVEENNVHRGLAIWKEILPIVHLYTYQKLGPVADIPIYRGMLQLAGRYGGYSREPFTALNETQLEQLQAELRQAGWLK
ncbi:MAG: dihydrodipicolinate synthase family protein [Planctomycetaceae bacterium]